MTVCPECGVDNDASADRCRSCTAALDNAAARALIGQEVMGVYRILDVVGKGGMSVVYKARHKMTDQVVALKILPAELAIHGDIKARFLEEAKALARLEHPNIVRLYNFGEEGGRFVLAMQFVDGTTFERKIFSAGRLEWRDAVAVARQVLRALDFAHQRGIIHRDIKPSNVLVRPDGSAMVMDFGIAKMGHGSSRLTATGQTMGTVRYMSPEQVRGQVVDHRSDLYSLGATLFEAVVGDTPFDGATHFEIMMKHLNEAPPSIFGRGFDAPKDLDRVILRSLSKVPADRYQRASDFMADLARLDAGEPVAEPVAEIVSERDLAPRAETGLAAALEPDLPRPRKVAPPPPITANAWRWAVSGLTVAVAAGTVLFLAYRPQAGKPAVTAPPVADTGWPEPALLPDAHPVVDHRFEAPELLRVISPHEVDTTAVVRAYVAARTRFTEWAATRHAAQVSVRPLNLVLASPDGVCSAVTRFGRTTAPADCREKPPRFFYVPRSATLYVLDDDKLLATNLPEGTSQHVCAQTEALLEKGCMKTVLPPYWDEVEKR